MAVLPYMIMMRILYDTKIMKTDKEQIVRPFSQSVSPSLLQELLSLRVKMLLCSIRALKQLPKF